MLKLQGLILILPLNKWRYRLNYSIANRLFPDTYNDMHRWWIKTSMHERQKFSLRVQFPPSGLSYKDMRLKTQITAVQTLILFENLYHHSGSGFKWMLFVTVPGRFRLFSWFAKFMFRIPSFASQVVAQSIIWEIAVSDNIEMKRTKQGWQYGPNKFLRNQKINGE